MNNVVFFKKVLGVLGEAGLEIHGDNLVYSDVICIYDKNSLLLIIFGIDYLNTLGLVNDRQQVQ